MGQWIFYHHLPSGWSFHTWQTPYASAHDAALADEFGEGDVRVGQDTLSSKWFIFRGGIHFLTDDLPDNTTITSAAVAIVQSHINPNNPLLADFDLHLVEGAGLHDAPGVAGDFGYLLHKVTSHGSITIPQGGLARGIYHNIILNALGRADINPTGWTRYGLRSSDDINSNTDHVVDDYISIGFYGFTFFAALIRTMDATEITGGIKLNGKLSEEGLTRMSPKLIINVVDSGNYSNIDVRFQYGIDNVYENSTEWQSNQEIEAEFTESVTELTLGVTYKYRAQLRVLLDDGSYYNIAGDTKTITVIAVYPSRVSVLIHRYDRGVYNMEILFGDITAESGVPRVHTGSEKSYIPKDEWGKLPGYQPKVIECPSGYHIAYNNWDIQKQYPYCVKDEETPPWDGYWGGLFA